MERDNAVNVHTTREHINQITKCLNASKIKKFKNSLCCQFHASRVLESMIGIFNRNKFYQIIIGKSLSGIKRNDFVLCAVQNQNILCKIKIILLLNIRNCGSEPDGCASPP